jgi:hypothetical protein
MREPVSVAIVTFHAERDLGDVRRDHPQGSGDGG